ncbi:unnamed protein product, partial [Musa textilis]
GYRPLPRGRRRSLSSPSPPPPWLSPQVNLPPSLTPGPSRLPHHRRAAARRGQSARQPRPPRQTLRPHHVPPARLPRLRRRLQRRRRPRLSQDPRRAVRQPPRPPQRPGRQLPPPGPGHGRLQPDVEAPPQGMQPPHAGRKGLRRLGRRPAGRVRTDDPLHARPGHEGRAGGAVGRARVRAGEHPRHGPGEQKSVRHPRGGVQQVQEHCARHAHGRGAVQHRRLPLHRVDGPPGIQAKMRSVHVRFDAMLTKLLQEHEASKKERQGRPDFIDKLMENRVTEDGQTITDVNIKALISDLFTAGTDTSAVTVEWAMAEMLRNPAILKRAQAEADAVVGRDRLLEESDLPKLAYLQAVCKEALRLHPSTPLSLPHFSYEECEVGGYRIPSNSRLLVNIWAIGRDPKVWADPLVFDPDRFVAGGEGAKYDPHGNDFEFIPFGAGRRICSGKLTGMVFVQYMLGALVHSFDWRLPDGEEELDMEEKHGLTISKAVPLKVLLTPRLSAAAYI